MSLTNLMKSAAGTRPFCNQKAGILSREHPECRRIHQAGWHKMVNLAAQAAGSPDFDENQLRLTMAAVAQRSYGNGDTVNQALETGWKLGVDHSMADGIITQDEETRLREFRDHLALGSDTADPSAIGQLDRASQDRLMLDARLAAIAVFDGGAHLHSLTETLRQPNLSQDEQTMLLVQAWEAAVEGALGDGLFTLDEGNALTRYINHFNLTQAQVDANGVHRSLSRDDCEIKIPAPKQRVAPLPHPLKGRQCRGNHPSSAMMAGRQSYDIETRTASIQPPAVYHRRPAIPFPGSVLDLL